jgi:hypothetical protein
MAMRDDFKPEVKDILARRVGMRCSNPNCRQLTSGPQEDPLKAVNIGVAAHITAASTKGPRYDKTLSAEGRGSIENGLWLCQNCAKLVDNDATRYSIDLLRRWKALSEEAARLDIESPNNFGVAATTNDEDLIRFYAQCFDRPAFQDRFHQEGSMEAFDKAIEDTLTALNTGCLRSRDGGVLARAKGKAYLQDKELRNQMDVIGDLFACDPIAIRRCAQARADSWKRGFLLHPRSGGGAVDGRNARASAVNLWRGVRHGRRAGCVLSAAAPALVTHAA